MGEEVLSGVFNMRDIHEMLLINGCMLLALLDEQISHWVAHQAVITH